MDVQRKKKKTKSLYMHYSVAQTDSDMHSTDATYIYITFKTPIQNRKMTF